MSKLLDRFRRGFGWVPDRYWELSRISRMDLLGLRDSYKQRLADRRFQEEVMACIDEVERSCGIKNS